MNYDQQFIANVSLHIDKNATERAPCLHDQLGQIWLHIFDVFSTFTVFDAVM